MSKTAKTSIQRLLWLAYYKLGRAVTGLPLWWLRIGSRDLGERLSAFVRRILPSSSREESVTLWNGCTMVFPPCYQDLDHYLQGVYERFTTCIVQECLREGMVFIDIGAHLGYYSLIASRLVGPSGRVYAFEPDPTHFHYLSLNVKGNDCRNVTLIQKAVANKTSTLSFFSQPVAGSSSFYYRSVLSSPVTVEATTLDDFMSVEKWPEVALIKMDIEGAEKVALQGMRELSHRNPSLKLIIEFELRRMHAAGTTPEELISTLQELGFTKFYVIEGSLRPIQLHVDLPKDIPILISEARKQFYVNILCEKG